MTVGHNKKTRALADFRAFADFVRRSTALDDFEDEREKQARIARLLADPPAFCRYYFPHYCQSPFAAFHRRFFKAVIKNERGYVVRAWARAHAKSVSTFMAALYLKFTGQARAVLWVSRTFDNACELLAPIQTELESNQRLRADFGDQIRHGNWEDGKFITADGCSFRAIGMGQSPRGTRNAETRPDLIVCDDVDSDEVVRNPKRLDDHWDWISSALMGCFDIAGRGRFILVNNRIAKDCLLMRAADNPKADFEQIDIYDKAGRPSWAERFSAEACQDMIDKMGLRAAQKEYFNNPLTAGSVFKAEYVRYGKMKPLRDYKALVFYTDPSFKASAKSDFKASVLLGLSGDEWHVYKVFCDQTSVKVMWEWHYEIYELCQAAGATVHMAMEANFMQGLHFDTLDRLARDRYPIPVSPDRRKKPDKFQRIESMSPAFERGKVVFNEAERNNPHLQRGIEQLLLIQKGSRSPDDFPDALESAMFLARQRSQTGSQPVTVGRRRTNQKRY